MDKKYLRIFILLTSILFFKQNTTFAIDQDGPGGIPNFYNRHIDCLHEYVGGNLLIGSEILVAGGILTCSIGAAKHISNYLKDK